MSNLVELKKQESNSQPIDLLEIQEEMLNTIEFVDEYAWKRGLLGGLDWGMQSLNKAFDGLNSGLHLIAGQPNVGRQV